MMPDSLWGRHVPFLGTWGLSCSWSWPHCPRVPGAWAELPGDLGGRPPARGEEGGISLGHSLLGTDCPGRGCPGGRGPTHQKEPVEGPQGARASQPRPLSCSGETPGMSTAMTPQNLHSQKPHPIACCSRSRPEPLTAPPSMMAACPLQPFAPSTSSPVKPSVTTRHSPYRAGGHPIGIQAQWAWSWAWSPRWPRALPGAGSAWPL